MRHEICPAAELDPGERTIVDLEGLSVGVFNVDGEYYALNNVCPHQLAPLCKGTLTGTTSAASPGEFGEWERDGEVLRCPWHGWEFDVTNGESLFNPHLTTRTFEAGVEPSENESGNENENENEGEGEGENEYGVGLAGDPPPVDTYDVAVESEMVVVYL